MKRAATESSQTMSRGSIGAKRLFQGFIRCMEINPKRSQVNSSSIKRCVNGKGWVGCVVKWEIIGDQALAGNFSPRGNIRPPILVPSYEACNYPGI